MTHGSRGDTIAVIAQALQAADLPVDFADERTVVTELPGDHKLKTTVSLAVGDRALTVNAFVVRRPEENTERVYRWLLERNRRLHYVAYALDPLGDVYLSGQVPLSAVTPELLDQVLGAVLSTADGDFDHLVALGFESSIRAEWKWRLERGESTDNLQAFAHLAPGAQDAAGFGHER